MFHSRGKRNKINRLRERFLRMYSNKKSAFIELLENNSASIHKKNSRFFSIEMFKFKIGLALELCKEMILQNRQNRYKSRNNADNADNANFTLPLVKPESLSYLGPKFWEILPLEIKQTKSRSINSMKILDFL